MTVVAACNELRRNYDTYIVGLPPTDFFLAPWHGYWIFVTASGTLTYDP
jgi:hypothetical protein